jgi:hypothetical protein
MELAKPISTRSKDETTMEKTDHQTIPSNKKKSNIARILSCLAVGLKHAASPFLPSTKTPPSVKGTAVPSGLGLQLSVKDTAESSRPEYLQSPGPLMYLIPEMTPEQIASIRYNEAAEPSPPDWIAEDGSLVYVMDDFTLDPQKNETPTPKENPMNELAEIKEKIELVKLEIKTLERLFQIVSKRFRHTEESTAGDVSTRPAGESCEA